MRLPVNALGDWLSPLPAADEIARTLTSIGFEVEGREDSPEGAVLEINVTPNRGDALSVRGLARELCAALERPFAEPAPPALPPGKGNSSLAILLPDARCPRYLGVEIRGVTNGPSPAAVQKRLEAFGMRPISILVDAANWVMLELGQPLHTFDLDTLKGGITVRAAKPGEKLVTLDGQTRDLTPWPVKGQSFAPMMICDGEAGVRTIAFAGVMGGFDTEISGKTKNIFLEAATFEPLTIRRTARKFTLLSEASQRFERGVDPALPALAAARFVQLLREWGAGGEIAGWRMAETFRPEARAIVLHDAAITRLLGIVVPRTFIENRLAALGLVCRDCKPDICRWEIPSWRSDLAIEEDLIEEIGRHYGYDRIPERLPPGNDSAPGRTALQKRLELLRQKAISLGFSEAVTIPFTAEEEQIFFTDLNELDRAIRIENPIWLNHPDLRVKLATTLLPVVFHNLQPDVLEGRQADVRLFEIGTTFAKSDDQANSRREKIALSLVVTLPLKSSPKERHYHLEDLVHQLFGVKLCCGTSYGSGGYGYGHLHDVTQKFNEHPVEIGFLNSYQPQSHIDFNKLNTKLNAAIGFIHVHDVLRLEFPTVKIKPLPRFPAIIRDLNLLIPIPQQDNEMHEGNDHLPLNRISAAIRSACIDFLENHHNLDRGFFGKGLPDGHFALAMRFTFRKPDGTRTAEEAEAGLEKIRAALAKIGVTVRGAS